MLYPIRTSAASRRIRSTQELTTSCSCATATISTPSTSSTVSSATTVRRYGDSSPYRWKLVAIWMMQSPGLSGSGNLPLSEYTSMSQLASTRGGRTVSGDGPTSVNEHDTSTSQVVAGSDSPGTGVERATRIHCAGLMPRTWNSRTTGSTDAS